MILQLKPPYGENIYVDSHSIISVQSAGSGQCLLQLEGGLTPITVRGNPDDYRYILDRSLNRLEAEHIKFSEETKVHLIWCIAIVTIFTIFMFNTSACDTKNRANKLQACVGMMQSKDVPRAVKKSLLDRGHCDPSIR